MTTSESPFFLTKVECPICKTINEFETIKRGAYTETDRDTDFCPTGRKWRNPRYQAYNPLLYFAATCSNCFYTREFNNSFKEWKNDAYFKTYRLKLVKEQHLELLAKSESIIKAIGSELDPNRYPNETAILKLILAIIDESLNERAINLDLGRYYLRIGWLFREMERGGNPNLQVIKGHLIGVEHKFDKLKSMLEEIRFQVKEVEEAVASQFEDINISAEIKSILYPIRDKYSAELASLNELLSLVDGKAEALELVSHEHRQIALGTSSDDILPGFHNHHSFRDFLKTLANRRENIPLDETEALKFAVRHYKKAFEDGREIGDGNQKIQASYLIAELSRRVGDFDTAREYFNATIRTGQEFIYKNKGDQSRTALARKILELAIEQGKSNLATAQTG
jgi:uncharacterized protein (DUF2225 family)